LWQRNSTQKRILHPSASISTQKYSLSLLNDINDQFERLFANRERNHCHLKQDSYLPSKLFRNFWEAIISGNRKSWT
jgi:hypothetical protein